MFFKPEDFAKQMQEQMEKVFVEKFNEMIRNPMILGSMNKTVEAGLDNKAKVNDLTADWLTKLNLPTKQDIARVMQYLQQIEARILDLEEHLETLGDQFRTLTEILHAQFHATVPSAPPAPKLKKAAPPAKSATRKPAKPSAKKPAKLAAKKPAKSGKKGK